MKKLFMFREVRLAILRLCENTDSLVRQSPVLMIFGGNEVTIGLLRNNIGSIPNLP